MSEKKKNNLRKCTNLYITNKNNIFFVHIYARILLCVSIFERKEKKKDTHSQKLRIRAIETNDSTKTKKTSYLVKSQKVFNVHLSGVKAFFKLHGVLGQNYFF